MWGSCFSRLVDGKSGVVKCKVGRGRSDWFTLKVFGDLETWSLPITLSLKLPKVDCEELAIEFSYCKNQK
jgi:hypothetical protein